MLHAQRARARSPPSDAAPAGGGHGAGTPGSGHVSVLEGLQGGYGCRAGWLGALTWGLLILICKEGMGQAVLVLLRAPQ